MYRQIVTNDDLSKIVETNDQWIRSRTWIRRRIATDDSTSDMAAKAAKKAIEQAGIDPAEIGLIILGTSSPITASQMEPARSRQRWAQLMQPALISSSACTGFRVCFKHCTCLYFFRSL